jgi:CRISPR-associated exonuclease Cas4
VAAHEDLIPVSALEHHAYCPRQAALIHVEGIFTDDRRTAEGTVAHATVHAERPLRRTSGAGVRLVSGLPIRSERLGVFGYCDQVEFFDGVVVPVEHKIGPYLVGGPADVQVAAQALCLREAGLTVPYGAIFSRHDRRRHVVALTDALLLRVERIVAEIRAAWATERLPPPVADARCRRCSLLEDCLPRLGPFVRARRAALFEAMPVGGLGCVSLRTPFTR